MALAADVELMVKAIGPRERKPACFAEPPFHGQPMPPIV